jgi:hypothetical protein
VPVSSQRWGVGEIILKSENYADAAGVKAGAEALRKNFAKAKIDPETGTAVGYGGGVNVKKAADTKPKADAKKVPAKFRARLARIMREAAELEEMIA